MAHPTRYLILPAQGLHASATAASSAATTTLQGLAHKAGVTSMRTRLQGVVKATAQARTKAVTKAAANLKAAGFNLVASLNEDGVKLVESTPEMIAALRFEQPGLRAVPEVFYSPAVSIARIIHRVAVTGVLARLLSNDTARLNMQPRDASRADAIKSLLFAQCESLGHGITNEGKGLPA